MSNPPVVSGQSARRESILNDTEALFEIDDSLYADPQWHEGYASTTIGVGQVWRFNEVIEAQALDVGVDADWLRSIMYLENSQGMLRDYAGVMAFQELDSILPMNINPSLWGGIGGVSAADFYTVEGNIRAGALLIKAITDRLAVEDRTLEKGLA